MVNNFFGYSSVLDSERLGQGIDPLADIDIHPTREQAQAARPEGTVFLTTLTTKDREYFHVRDWFQQDGNWYEGAWGRDFLYYDDAYEYADGSGKDGGPAEIELMVPTTTTKTVSGRPGHNPIEIGTTTVWDPFPLVGRIEERPDLTLTVPVPTHRSKIDAAAAEHDWSSTEDRDNPYFVRYRKGHRYVSVRYSYNGRVITASSSDRYIDKNKLKRIIELLRAR